MPKKAKIGKQRKDKFYKLAKETGYRSRAAFKLLQLNRKFEFLPKSRVLIDLCAAPGGWLQVAQQSMPVASIIIGVDLVPIRPIANVITIQEDITTDKCRQALKKQLKTWKADTVLHDGAPNVGKSWIHDAFTQNQLTLSALKLASEMLVKGGWFVTKVFRSKDYLSLVWAFKKLFKRVHVTKPQASRNESAEIFIVCQGYLAPARIDPKFLDPAHIFKDVQNKSETKANIDLIAKPRVKAEGYEDDTAGYNKLKASEFIFSENHLDKLSKCSEIVFDDDDIRDHKLTTEEIKQCCADIKVLGKADVRKLLIWRKQLLLSIKNVKDDKEVVQEDKEDNEEQELDDVVKEAEDLELSKLQQAKRKKKKLLKEKRRTHERLNLKMIIKDDEPIIQEDRELFKLSLIKNKKELSQIEDETNLEFSCEPPETKLDVASKYRKTHVPYERHEKGEVQIEAEPEKEESIYSSDDQVSELEFESENEEVESNNGDDTEEVLEGKKNPLVVDLVERPDRVKDTVEKWFDKEDFTNAGGDSDIELDLLAESYVNKKSKENEKKSSVAEEKSVAVELNDDENNSENELDDEEKEDVSKSAGKEKDMSKPNKKKRKNVKLNAEGLALGSLLVQSKKMKRDIIEAAYNRYASNDENLPKWFVEDERKHFRKQMPVTAEMVAEYKRMMREINARPIKKVVEAKARKKRRAARRLEKARKKAEKITEHPDMSSTEKVEQLKEIYKKALPKEDRRITYIVAKKGAGRKVARPDGVKGRFKVVDRRMKKDARRQKMLLKSNKNKSKKKAMQRKR